MFDRPQAGNRAVLVHIALSSQREEQEDVEELRQLSLSAGAEIVGEVTGSRSHPDPGLFIGSGKVAEIRALVQEQQADLVIFNHALSPVQERNLERELSCRVLDRVGLILDIFASRAHTHEGQLQVELAQLEHLRTRLVRGWTHLERQRGGIGLRGPGETQLELDRRMLGQRIRTLKQRLEKVRAGRALRRRARQRAPITTVSLVGYTNAGKSTLFNRLTQAQVLAADQLFATLDPTMRRLSLPSGMHVVLTDTVGFVRHLPHQLVAAFRATLEEVAAADLLVHVVDAANPEHAAQMEQVAAVLREIGADEIPCITVFNKIDCLDRGPAVLHNADGLPERVWLSAHTGDGIPMLLEALDRQLGAERVRLRVHLTPGEGRWRARLHEHGQVLQEDPDEQGGWSMAVELDPATWGRFRQQGLRAQRLEREGEFISSRT
ncbi:MAG: ribosome rescue GTPase HflX [Pseudomonadota bacterium]|uniref:ribosome rescue GTPase HflX n=1 Tax=Thermithiobacillus tepidarius TaxID=929 RepID=UPI0004240153|nr:ribosome rescue GTPase HflX [Thermithiobacillus tepidarius]